MTALSLYPNVNPIHLGKSTHCTNYNSLLTSGNRMIRVTAVIEAGLETLEENQEVQFEMVDGRDGRECAGDIKIS